MIGPDAFMITHIAEIAQRVANNQVPTISVYRPFTVAGGLMSYGPDTADIFRQAASYDGLPASTSPLWGARIGLMSVGEYF